MTEIAETGGEILIPKHLRLEWMDALALDPDLPPVAFKVAGVIGSHFNHDSGETFIKQETIARKMGLSLRTVQSAISELERRGYLIVQRRDLGVRASDGRRVAGGKGVANRYLPAIQKARLAATASSLKVAMHCVHSWGQRTQNPAPKDAADCVPTHKVINPERESASRSPRARVDSIEMDFDEWFAEYPHRVERARALIAYRHARSRGTTVEQLKRGLRTYVETHRPGNAWCNPANWLDRKKWTDEPADQRQTNLLLPVDGGKNAASREAAYVAAQLERIRLERSEPTDARGAA